MLVSFYFFPTNSVALKAFLLLYFRRFEPVKCGYKINGKTNVHVSPVLIAEVYFKKREKLMALQRHAPLHINKERTRIFDEKEYYELVCFRIVEVCSKSR